MSIEINLVEDWVAIVLREVEHLKKQGFIFNTFKQWKLLREEELKARLKDSTGATYDNTVRSLRTAQLKEDYQEYLLFTYMNLRHRLIECRPRKIHLSNSFICPDEHACGFRILKNKILSGENLFPFLSRRIFRPHKHDGLLYDWGIHHLHLGTERDKKYRHLNQGTKEILYVFFKEDEAYFLCIDDHGRWADEAILKIIHDDFPELLEPFKMKGIKGPESNWPPAERGALRKSGITSFVMFDDVVYMSPGLGVVTSGDSFKALMNMDATFYLYKRANEHIKNNVEQYIDQLPEKQKVDMAGLHLKMTTLHSGLIAASDSTKGVDVLLYVNQETTTFTDMSILTRS